MNASHSSAVAIGSTVSWGISAGNQTVGSIQGIVVAVNINKSVESAPCRNEDGTKIGEAVYDANYSGSVTLQVAASVTNDSVSMKNTVTMGGRTYRVKSVELTESNQDYKKFRLQVESSAVTYSYTMINANIS